MEIGRLLAERYELVRPLAEGATSTVWVARDRLGDGEVAVKSISLDAAGWRAEVRDRFMKEARLLALSRHEHLVGVRDVGETDDGFLYLVLELLEGETLADRIGREGSIPWQDAGSIALAITRGVAALHRTGVVHRDLKPANIVLHRTPSGPVPKIIDLGISKVRAAAADPELCATLTATGQVLGTPQYMSYEQALGERDVDARSDVWALGVILYEMLAGRRPFEAPNVNAVLAAIRRREETPLAEVNGDVPAPLVEIVDRCLRTERAERFKDAIELEDALLTALARSAAGVTDKPAAAPSPPAKSSLAPAPAKKSLPPPPAPPPAPHRANGLRRSHVVVGGLVALAAAAAVVASGIGSDNSPTPRPADAPAANDAPPPPPPPPPAVVPDTTASRGDTNGAPTTPTAGGGDTRPPQTAPSPSPAATPRPVQKGKGRVTGVDGPGF
ncbi:serine/threonine-protein kinase [Polyangium aurulentum]|uniref:serine/threonine-protein kinase n=1 Tax=Polyangium aurulentum TaxID=2567896 RepID=UPI0010AE421C|nr:serine/threonine-protein kinase [Polyangium aurulentum]UQA56611.1 serine/threonine protein kinase [Polyangium aurulentum]